MGRKSFSISRFFQELKRRHVLRAIVMYAAAAFITLQLVDILTPALKLPPWILTIVIIILAVGFPIVAILSWIFDFTPQGVKKLGAFEEHDNEEIPVKSGRRKFRFSDGLIIVLFIAVGVLLYPKIFNKDKFNKLRNEDGRISLAVMPFNNLVGDTIFDVWQAGFQNLVISSLSNSEELEVRQYQAIRELLDSDNNINTASMVPSLAGTMAKKLDSKTVILGNLINAGNKIRINAQLMNAKTEEIFKTFQTEGEGLDQDEFIAMADTLSEMIRNYLEIEKLKKELDDQISHQSTTTRSAEAFKAYISGYDSFMSLEFLPAARWFYRSVQTDPEFIEAYVMLSFACHQLNYIKDAKEWVAKAYEKSDKMSYKDKLMVDMINSFYYETPDEQISYIKQLIDLEELNPFYWANLGSVYFGLNDYENCIYSLEKAFEIHEKWGTDYKNPFVYYILGHSLHMIGDHKREKEILDMGLNLYPDHQMVIQTKAICALSHDETKKAQDLIEKYINVRETVTLCPAHRIETGLGAIYAGAKKIDEAELRFRKAVEIASDDPDMINELAFFLIDQTDNQEKISEGLQLIEKALEDDPDNWLFLDTKAWGLYKLGNNTEALNLLRKSWDNRPAYNHGVYEHLKTVEKALDKENI